MLAQIRSSCGDSTSIVRRQSRESRAGGGRARLGPVVEGRARRMRHQKQVVDHRFGSPRWRQAILARGALPVAAEPFSCSTLLTGAIARAMKRRPRCGPRPNGRAQRCPCPSCPGAGYELIEGHRCASTAASSSRSIFAAVGARQPTSRAHVLEVRIQSPPVVSQANFRIAPLARSDLHPPVLDSVHLPVCHPGVSLVIDTSAPHA